MGGCWQGSMLQSIERYMKQAIVDKEPSVSSAALTSSLVTIAISSHLISSSLPFVTLPPGRVPSVVMSMSVCVSVCLFLFPSVLWRCWLGDRKSIWPVKKLEWWDASVVICLGSGQICIWLSWCHCHSLSLAPVNPDWFYLSGTNSPG